MASGVQNWAWANHGLSFYEQDPKYKQCKHVVKTSLPSLIKCFHFVRTSKHSALHNSLPPNISFQNCYNAIMGSQRPVEGNSELHPVRRGRCITHASIKKLGEDLQRSVKGFLPKVSAPYKKVTCLLIAWAHAYQQDEGGVGQDFDEFRDLMLEHYLFEVDEYLVDRTETQKTIGREMTEKCTQVRPQQDELLIVYYTGHSYYQEWSKHTIFT